MSAVRDYTAIPHEYMEELEHLSDEEFGRLVRALMRYSISGEEDPGALTGCERYSWVRVRMREDRFRRAFLDQAAARSEQGRRAAEKRWARRREESSADACPRSAGIAPDANTETNTETHTETHTETEAYPDPDQCAAGGGDGGERAEEENAEDAALGQVAAVYERVLGARPTAYIRSCLGEYLRALPPEVIERAMDIAAANRIPRWNYLRGILDRYLAEEVTSLADARDRDDRARRRNAPPAPPSPAQRDAETEKTLAQIRRLMEKSRAAGEAPPPP